MERGGGGGGGDGGGRGRGGGGYGGEGRGRGRSRGGGGGGRHGGDRYQYHHQPRYDDQIEQSRGSWRQTGPDRDQVEAVPARIVPGEGSTRDSGHGGDGGGGRGGERGWWTPRRAQEPLPSSSAVAQPNPVESNRPSPGTKKTLCRNGLKLCLLFSQ